MGRGLLRCMGLLWLLWLLGRCGLALPETVGDPVEPRVTLSAERIELRVLLHTLARLAGVDLVLGQGVGGEVTLNLRDALWSQALDTILRAQGLAASRTGGLLWIGTRQQQLDADKLDAEARQQQEQGGTLHTRGWSLRYALASQLASWLQGQGGGGAHWLSARGSALADPRTNQLFVVDTEERLARLQPMLDAVDRPVRQVLIEARLVEASRQFGRSLGVRFGRRWPSGSASGPAHGIDLPAGSLPNPALDKLSAATLTLIGAGASAGLELELSALEADGQGQVIAAPHLLTAEQQQAVIEQGSEIPYQHASASGATAVSFVKAVLGLRVTPRITPDGQVQMQVEIHKDSVGQSTPAGPAINTSTLSTQVQVEDGGTVVLGGIAASDARTLTAGLPWLQRLPLFGALFGASSRSRSSSELLVFLTPRVLGDAPRQPVR